MKIDFGSVFLTNPEHEQTFSLVEGAVQDVAGSIAGASKFITPEALNLSIDTLTFIVTDFVSTVTSYATSAFKKYASPDFAIQIATDITKKTLAYTTDNLENPAVSKNSYFAQVLNQLIKNKNRAERGRRLRRRAFSPTDNWFLTVCRLRFSFWAISSLLSPSYLER